MPLFRYLLGFALLAFTLLSAEPAFPELTSRVVDEATLFSAAQKAELESILENHENNTSNQIVVVTLKSLDGYDIRDYGLELGRAWGIGQKDKNNGVLLIIAPNERKVSIEVGYGLEGALPDATAKSIIDQEILPYFKEGDYFGGTKLGVGAIISAIKGEYAPYEFASSSKSFKFSDLIVPLIFLFV
ncbi:MAG: TPM domain-containing protein [Sulfurovaceae bacterium]